MGTGINMRVIFSSTSLATRHKADLSFGSLEQKKFDRIFPIFLMNTDEKDQMTKGMESVFSKVKKQGMWKNNESIKVMDLGCGDGFASSKIFAMVKKFFPTQIFQVKAFDNNAQQLADYQTRFAASENIKVKTLKSDVFSRVPEGAEDILVASHSLYHSPVDNLKAIIPSMANSINDKGLVVISLLKDNSDFSKIQRQYGRYVTSEGETNPVGVEMKDISKVIKSNPDIASKTLKSSYKSYVYFPEIPGGFESFKNWQMYASARPAPNKESQLTLDLLEFIVHGDFDKLRKANQLGGFLQTVEKMFEENGKSTIGQLRINFNGENVFLLGSKLFDTVRIK